MRLHRLLALGSLATFALLAACSDSSTNFQFSNNVTGGTGGTGGKSTAGNTSTGDDDDDDNGTAGTGIIITPGGGSSGSAGSGTSNCTTGSGSDKDGDGWTTEEGDCNDCDPNVNPGAIDVVNYKKDKDGKPTDELADTQIDEDCSGAPATADDPTSCDDGLALSTTTDPFDAAKAIGLCNKAEENPTDKKDRKWGVLSAGFNSIAGGFLKTPLAPGVQVGIVPGFGDETQPREGVRSLVMSSAEARAPGQSGYKASHCSTGTGLPGFTPSAAAPGFPKKSHCGNGEDPEGGEPYNPMALDLKIRVPTNAKSLRFNFRFFSCEYPVYTCQTFNDVFAVIMTPSPLTEGAMYDPNTKSANIAFDNNQNVIGVNNAEFFTACEPGGGADYVNCKSGSSSQLKGSGFETHGGSAWLATQVNIPKDESGKTASIIYLRFAIWNAGDTSLNSTAVIDNFQWSADEGSATPVTIIDPPGDIH